MQKHPNGITTVDKKLNNIKEMTSFSGRLAKGYMNKILSIDLTAEQYEIKALDPKQAYLFLGGRGFGISFLFNCFRKLEESGKYKNAFLEVDPLSADNPIVISTSPTTGTKMPTSGRFHMNYKSPLTGALGSTNAGGHWSVALKKAGYDVILITGKAKKPLYLLISDKGVEFFSAEHLREMNSIETREVIVANHSKKTQVLTIGKGGKNLSHFAAVLSDRGKALGRGGGGTVFGAKNLYAIAALPGTETKIEVADEASLKIKDQSGPGYHAKLKLDMGKFTKKEKTYGILSSMGSLGLLGMVDNFDQLIHNNMKDTRHRLEDIEKINGEALRYHAQNSEAGKTKIEVKKGSCFNCPIVCKRETKLIDGAGNVIETGEGPEFESVTLLGANLSIYDLVVITEANFLANHFGLDTISLGSTIAAFFDLYGVIKQRKTSLNPAEQLFMDDVADFATEVGEPGFGKPELLIPLVKLIGESIGIGKYLAQGSYRFCQRYGHVELSMSVKKMELPAYDPRTSFSQALCYEMSNRGGCHLEGGYTAPYSYCAGYAEWPGNRIEGTPLVAKNATLKNVTLDILGVCSYASFSLGLDEFASLLTAVSGDEHNTGTLKTIALRTITLERTFNYLCGLTHKDDWLPDRFYNEQIQIRNEPTICNRSDFRKMHKNYYNSVGWNNEGIPTQKTLEEMDLLDYVAGNLSDLFLQEITP